MGLTAMAESSGATEPELDLGRFHVETRRVLLLRGNAIPLSGLVARLQPVDREYELALCYHADVLGIVVVRRNRRPGGIRSEEHVAVFRRQPERIERSFELWELAQQFRKMGHVDFLTDPSKSQQPRSVTVGDLLPVRLAYGKRFQKRGPHLVRLVRPVYRKENVVGAERE